MSLNRLADVLKLKCVLNYCLDASPVSAFWEDISLAVRYSVNAYPLCKGFVFDVGVAIVGNRSI